MKNSIYPCLWFDGQAKAAAEFYCSIFPNSRITTDTPMVVNWEMDGVKVMGLNGGPMFKINPSISFFVSCGTVEEIDTIWSRLMEGGSAMMPLDKYPWSERYGWVADKFGMTWQLMLGEVPAGMQKINPSFLFTGDQFGKARAALDLYASLFPDSKVHTPNLYAEGEGQPVGYLKFGHFTLSDNLFSAMDGPGEHGFKFNEGVSLVAECADQEEIDKYWNALTANGGRESQCGWLVDPFGVSWQIIPKNLGSLIMNPENGGRAMQALMKMKKLDIEALKNA